MMWQKIRVALVSMVMMTMAVIPATAEQVIMVDFNEGVLYHWYGTREEPDRYPVVLPKVDVQEVMDLESPVHGKFTQADHRPTWWPTANMRHRKPSLPQSVPYGHRFHPIGVYRLRIDWQNPNDQSYWSSIRIHGGADHQDLYAEKSAGCIRMLDPDVTEMVKNIGDYGGEIRVTFGRL